MLAVGANAIKALAAGKPLDLSLLATLPIDAAACLFVPIDGALFLIEAAYLGWHQSSVRRLLLGRSSPRMKAASAAPSRNQRSKSTLARSWQETRGA